MQNLLFDDLTVAPAVPKRKGEPAEWGTYQGGKLSGLADMLPEPAEWGVLSDDVAAAGGAHPASPRKASGAREAKANGKPPAAARKRLADKLRKWADGLQREIDNALRPMTQNHTPKRGREYLKRLHAGHDLQRAQRAMRALADLADADRVPAILADVNTKARILRMTQTHADCSGGYYSYRETDRPCDIGQAAAELWKLLNPADDMAARAESKREALLRELRDSPRPGFFPTPENVGRMLIDLAYIEPEHSVLEPSAGIGSLAALCPDRDRVACVEIDRTACDLLLADGYDADRADFLTDWNPDDIPRRFDRVVMNPPFERLADIDHIQHAFRFLAPNGRLVAIVSNGTRTRTGNKATRFRQWVDEQGGEWRELPAGAFDTVDAFRRTGVACSLLILDADA